MAKAEEKINDVRYDEDGELRVVIVNNVGFHVGHEYVLENSSTFTIDQFVQHDGNWSAAQRQDGGGYDWMDVRTLYRRTRPVYPDTKAPVKAPPAKAS
jgi:hypothetical protein